MTIRESQQEEEYEHKKKHQINELHPKGVLIKRNT